MNHLTNLFTYAHAVSANTDFGAVNSLEAYVNLILNWAIPILGSISLLMMIYAGYLYMTSQGNPDSVNKAKDILVGVISGIALLFLIDLILKSIGVQ